MRLDGLADAYILSQAELDTRRSMRDTKASIEDMLRAARQLSAGTVQADAAERDALLAVYRVSGIDAAGALIRTRGLTLPAARRRVVAQQPAHDRPDPAGPPAQGAFDNTDNP